MEISKFMDTHDESLKIDKESSDGLAFALELLGVNQDEIEYFKTKLADKELS